MARKIKTPCRKRSLSKCKTAKKSCSYARGAKRRFCRTRKNKTKSILQILMS